MKLQLTVEIDGTDSFCEAQLTELETVVEGNEGVIIHTGGSQILADLVKVTELPAKGRG